MIMDPVITAYVISHAPPGHRYPRYFYVHIRRLHLYRDEWIIQADPVDRYGDFLVTNPDGTVRWDWCSASTATTYPLTQALHLASHHPQQQDVAPPPVTPDD